MALDCPQAGLLGDREFLIRFNGEVLRRQVPISGGIDLTGRCNLGCVHCYLGGLARVPAAELPGREWARIIGEAASEGCLYLLLTGGEPLLHPDFAEIYIAAKRAGLLVILFTNGTRVSEKTCALLRDYPPLWVEVSLYGASLATYGRTTGVPGAYRSCRRGLDRLARHGIPFKLKTMLLTETISDLDRLQAVARHYGVPFRFDPVVSAGLDGGRSPLSHRVEAAAAVACEMADPARREDWRKYLREHRPLLRAGKLYQCGAGRTGFHVDARGTLKPCVMSAAATADLRRKSFADGWREISARIDALVPARPCPCLECELRLLCAACPPLFELESGSAETPPAYLCELARLRRAVLADETPGRDEETIRVNGCLC